MKNGDISIAVTVGGFLVIAGSVFAALGAVFLLYKGMEWLVRLAMAYGAAWGLVAIAGGGILWIVGGLMYRAGILAQEKRASERFDA